MVANLTYVADAHAAYAHSCLFMIRAICCVFTSPVAYIAVLVKYFRRLWHLVSALQKRTSAAALVLSWHWFEWQHLSGPADRENLTSCLLREKYSILIAIAAQIMRQCWPRRRSAHRGLWFTHEQNDGRRQEFGHNCSYRHHNVVFGMLARDLSKVTTFHQTWRVTLHHGAPHQL